MTEEDLEPPARLTASLSASAAQSVRCSRRPDGVLMLDTPLRFPDGDRFPLYVDQDAQGVVLSDRGHTLMHISYEHDVDRWFDGPRAPLREQIVRDYGLVEQDGAFMIRASLDRIGESALLLAQALTKIHDLTFLRRTRAVSSFYEDLTGFLEGVLGDSRVLKDHVVPGVPAAENYRVDYCISSAREVPGFLFGVPGQAKARLATISLQHFRHHQVRFGSLIVYRDMSEIPRLDVARLTDVADSAVSSLSSEADLRRKVLSLAA